MAEMLSISFPFVKWVLPHASVDLDCLETKAEPASQTNQAIDVERGA